MIIGVSKQSDKRHFYLSTCLHWIPSDWWMFSKKWILGRPQNEIPSTVQHHRNKQKHSNWGQFSPISLRVFAISAMPVFWLPAGGGGKNWVAAPCRKGPFLEVTKEKCWGFPLRMLYSHCSWDVNFSLWSPVLEEWHWAVPWYLLWARTCWHCKIWLVSICEESRVGNSTTAQLYWKTTMTIRFSNSIWRWKRILVTENLWKFSLGVWSVRQAFSLFPFPALFGIRSPVLPDLVTWWWGLCAYNGRATRSAETQLEWTHSFAATWAVNRKGKSSFFFVLERWCQKITFFLRRFSEQNFMGWQKLRSQTSKRPDYADTKNARQVW